MTGLCGRHVPLTSHSASTGGPAPTGSSSGADSANSSETHSGSGTATSTAAAQTSVNAAGGLVVGGSFAGLFAMAAGILVL